jgi:hypothetical protein
MLPEVSPACLLQWVAEGALLPAVGCALWDSADAVQSVKWHVAVVSYSNATGDNSACRLWWLCCCWCWRVGVGWGGSGEWVWVWVVVVVVVVGGGGGGAAPPPPPPPPPPAPGAPNRPVFKAFCRLGSRLSTSPLAPTPRGKLLSQKAHSHPPARKFSTNPCPLRFRLSCPEPPPPRDSYTDGTTGLLHPSSPCRYRLFES